MNFTPTQWIVLAALDLIIKIVLVSFFGLLVTLGAAPLVLFIFAAIKLSILHGVCLLLGSILVRVLKLTHLKTPHAINFAITVVVTNAFFIGIYMAFATLPITPTHKGEIGPSVYNELILAAAFGVTNLLPICIVVVCRCLLRVFCRLWIAAQRSSHVDSSETLPP
jgi:hypothetical protein